MPGSGGGCWNMPRPGPCARELGVGSSEGCLAGILARCSHRTPNSQLPTPNSQLPTPNSLRRRHQLPREGQHLLDLGMRGDQAAHLGGDVGGETEMGGEPRYGGGAGMEAEEVETDGLEGGDRLAELCLDRVAEGAEIA